MGQFQPVAGPSQDEFNALSGQVTALNSKIDFGMYSTLPTGLPTSGVVAFGLNSNVTLDGQFIPAGARFVGYMNNHIGHFTGVYNGEDILALRYVAGTWSLLYSVNNKMTPEWHSAGAIQYSRCSGIACINISSSVSPDSNGKIGNIPAGYRPNITTYFFITTGGIATTSYLAYINTDGDVVIYTRGDTIAYAYGSCSYYRKRREAIESLYCILWGYTEKESLAVLEEFFVSR